MLETFWVNVKISEKRKEKGLVMEEVKMFQPHAALQSTPASVRTKAASQLPRSYQQHTHKTNLH